MTRASIHRPNRGSAAYVWINNNEHVCATTSEAHALLRRRGNPIQIAYRQTAGTSITEFVIEPHTVNQTQENAA